MDDISLNSSCEEKTSNIYASVVVETRTSKMGGVYTYGIPSGIEDAVSVGSTVLVPFGKKTTIGYVIEINESIDENVPFRVKPLNAVLNEPPLFNENLAKTLKWVSDHYLAPLSSTVKLAVPPMLAREIDEYLELAVPEIEALSVIPRKAIKKAAVIEEVSGSGGKISLKEIKSLCGDSIVGPIKELIHDGILKMKYEFGETKTSELHETVISIKPDYDSDESSIAFIEKTARRKDVVRWITEKGGEVPLREMLDKGGFSRELIKSFVENGIFSSSRSRVYRDPLSLFSQSSESVVLNEGQSKAFNAISEKIEAGRGGVFLLHGVTGSGKTEIYMRAIEKVLEKGGGSIVLVPEISLTPQLIERFMGRFDKNVALLHSGLSAGERFDQWTGIRAGEFDIVVGARSAVFAPVPNLKLIIVDEEHETAYKQEVQPRYNARDVAIKRALLSESVAILGSATPSLETLYRAKAGLCGYLRLEKRIDGMSLPEVEIVDISNYGNRVISPEMSESIIGLARSGEKGIIFLNRRGYSSFIQCEDCGSILSCKNCDVSLCFHKNPPYLKCHYCDYTTSGPFNCDICGKEASEHRGFGTERIEEEIKRIAPSMEIVRMDSDTTSTKGSHARILKSFKSGRAQLLIGTQMITKGLDIEDVTFVGVINADLSLSIPDFRATERTFQLISQVTGRCGRGSKPGKVIVQTRQPEHYSITMAASGSEASFYEKELEGRSAVSYPPFVKLANIVFSSDSKDIAKKAANDFRERFTCSTGYDERVSKVLGPAPAPIFRLRGMYRYHVLLKFAGSESDLPLFLKSIGQTVDEMYDFAGSRRQGVSDKMNIAVDVDPVSLL